MRPLAYMTPLTIIGALLCVLGLGVFLSAPLGNPVPPPQPVVFTDGDVNQTAPVEVSIVQVGEGGVEHPRFTTLRLPEAPNLRLAGVFAELRRQLLEEDVWPEALPAPTVFLYDRTARERVAILDFEIDEPIPVSVSQEQRILWSLERTAAAQSDGPDRLVILVNGRADRTFLGHIAVPSKLD